MQIRLPCVGSNCANNESVLTVLLERGFNISASLTVYALHLIHTFTHKPNLNFALDMRDLTK